MEDGRIVCNSCKEKIVGFRYCSLFCVNYNMCSTCERKSRKSELFIRMFEPLYGDNLSETYRNEQFVREIMHFKLSHNNREPVMGINHHVICDMCRREIRNIRYKCIDCENIDFCGNCKDICFTHRRHLLFRIVHPLHLSADTEIFVNTIMELKQSRENDGGFQDYGWDNLESQEQRPDVSEHHEYRYVICNKCNDLIEGFIFKCVDCPDFNLCSNCEPSSSHSGHLIIRFEEPLDEYMQSLLRRIISMRLSPNSEDFTDVDLEDHLVCSDLSESKIHEGVICDECEGSCRGYRYKCLQCPDYDLCTNCQIHENHERHFLIRIAEPLTTDIVNRKFVEKVMVMGSPPNDDNNDDFQGVDTFSDDTLSNERNDNIPDNNDAGSDDSWTTISQNDEDQNDGYDDDVADDQPKPSTSHQNNKPNDEERATVQNCTICYVQPSNVILLDCGHLCLCIQCLSGFMIRFPQCPLCKTDITKPPCRVFY